MTIIKEQITSLSKFLYEQSKSLGLNNPFSKIYKEIEDGDKGYAEKLKSLGWKEVKSSPKKTKKKSNAKVRK